MISLYNTPYGWVGRRYISSPSSTTSFQYLSSSSVLLGAILSPTPLARTSLFQRRIVEPDITQDGENEGGEYEGCMDIVWGYGEFCVMRVIRRLSLFFRLRLRCCIMLIISIKLKHHLLRFGICIVGRSDLHSFSKLSLSAAGWLLLVNFVEVCVGSARRVIQERRSWNMCETKGQDTGSLPVNFDSK